MPIQQELGMVDGAFRVIAARAIPGNEIGAGVLENRCVQLNSRFCLSRLCARVHQRRRNLLARFGHTTGKNLPTQAKTILQPAIFGAPGIGLERHQHGSAWLEGVPQGFCFCFRITHGIKRNGRGKFKHGSAVQG